MKSRHKVFKALLSGVVLPLSLVLTGHVAGQICVEPPQDMVSSWPGDGNADDIIDGNHGTLQNGATFATGMVGQALSFDGGMILSASPTPQAWTLAPALSRLSYGSTSTPCPRIKS